MVNLTQVEKFAGLKEIVGDNPIKAWLSASMVLQGMSDRGDEMKPEIAEYIIHCMNVIVENDLGDQKE